MARLRLIATAALALCTATSASAQSLIGTWSATVNWSQPSGLMITTSFTQDGRVQSTTQNHQGQSFLLSGVYQYDPGGRVLRFRWQDYLPRQTCVGGFCTPSPAPARLGVTNTNSIRFLNPNEFVASGATTVYLRSNAAGFPTGRRARP